MTYYKFVDSSGALKIVCNEAAYRDMSWSYRREVPVDIVSF
jgi:hypothetical protein